MTPLMSSDVIQKHDILFPVDTRDVSWHTKLGHEVPAPAYKAIIGKTARGGALLSIVSSTYKLVSNHDIFMSIEDTMMKEMTRDALRDVRITDTAARGGRDCYREYVFPNLICDVEHNAKRSDGVGFRIVVQNSYGGGAIKVLVGAIDFFCTNGMIIGAYEAAYARHTSGVKVDRFSALVTKGLNKFIAQGDVWKRWHNTQVTDSEAMKLLKQLASSPRNHDALYRQYLDEVAVRGNNLWSVYSAATYAATHNSGEFAVKRSSEDNAAAILNRRELAVAAWVSGEPAFADA